MTIERAIEILDPTHREHYDSIETVNEACRMGMKALDRLTAKKPIMETRVYDEDWGITMKVSVCPSCGKILRKSETYCLKCGQAIDRNYKYEDSLEEEIQWYANCTEK